MAAGASPTIVQHRHDEAIADLTAAAGLGGKDAATYYYMRGLAYKRKGDNAKAEEDFATAKKLGYKGK